MTPLNLGSLLCKEGLIKTYLVFSVYSFNKHIMSILFWLIIIFVCCGLLFLLTDCLGNVFCSVKPNPEPAKPIHHVSII